LGDLKHPGPGRISATLVTALARDAVAKFVCRDPARRVTLHGDIAYALAASTALDLRLHCDRAFDVRIIGADADRLHWTSIPASVAAGLGRSPLLLAHGLALVPSGAVHHPASGRSIESEWYYFEQLRDRAPRRKVSLAFEAAARDAVMIYRLKPLDSYWRLLRVTVDGEPPRELHATYNSTMLVSRSGSADVVSRWEIEFETDAPDWVDVHVL
jgi:hypothetical protein